MITSLTDKLGPHWARLQQIPPDVAGYVVLYKMYNWKKYKIVAKLFPTAKAAIEYIDDRQDIPAVYYYRAV